VILGQYKRVLLCSVVLVVLSAAAPGVVVTVEAHNPLSTLSAWTTFPPRINGLDDCLATWGGGCTSEWANAATSFFDLSWNDPNGLSGKIHMMNDAINLYIAVEIYNDDKDSYDCVTLLFDNNHSGPLSSGGAGKQDGDDLLIMCGDSTFNDLYAVGGGQLGDTSSGGTIDGAGKAGYGGGVWWFEMAHPLDTSDNSHDFSLSQGQTVGFSLIYQENGGSPITPATNVLSERDYKVSGCTEPDGSGCSFGLFGTTRDLSITGIEITQAIGKVDNFQSANPVYIPLVKGKATVVRVYVQSGPSGAPQTLSRVFLFGSSNGVGLGTVTGYVYAKPALASSRLTLADSANIQLPASWTNHESLTLRGFITTAVWAGIQETNHKNNWMKERTFQFSKHWDLRIYLVPIKTPAGLPTAAGIQAQENFLRAVYPTHKVTFVQGSWQQVGYWTGGISEPLINALEDVFFDVYTTQTPDLVYGFLAGTCGVSGTIGLAGAWWWNDHWGTAAAGMALQGCSEETMAHEIIHLLDLSDSGTWGRHVSNPNNNGDVTWGCGAKGPDPNWPRANDNIGDPGSDFGFDTRFPNAATALTVWPDTANDLMSYCGGWPSTVSNNFNGAWISDYHWAHLFTRLLAPGLPASSASPDGPVATAASSDVFKVAGRVFPSGRASIDSVLHETLRAPLFPRRVNASNPNATPYQLELVGADRTILASENFTRSFADIEGNSLDSEGFTILLPYVSSAVAIRLSQGGVLLAEHVRSANPPTVTLTSPIGEENWTGTQTVTWTGADPDGQPLLYTLQYSLDGGLTWELLVGNLTETTFTVESSTLRGGERVLLRVSASDGFYTVSDTSDVPFAIEDKPPTVTILQPSTHTNFTTDDQILLRGEVVDLEDRAIPDDRLEWSSDRDGVLGNGSQLSIYLSPGLQRITLKAVDSSGHEAEDSIVLNVTVPEPSLPPPPTTQGEPGILGVGLPILAAAVVIPIGAIVGALVILRRRKRRNSLREERPQEGSRPPS